MKLIGITIAYAAVFLLGWKIQEFNELLGHTVGVFGILGVTFFLVDYLARKMN